MNTLLSVPGVERKIALRPAWRVAHFRFVRCWEIVGTDGLYPKYPLKFRTREGAIKYAESILNGTLDRNV